MSDLISRQAAIEHLYGRLITSANNNVGVWEDAGIVFEEIATERLKRWMNEIPTIDPVKHGKWKREALGSTSGYGTTVMYKCSECERMAISRYRFCPNCGARMDEVEE